MNQTKTRIDATHMGSESLKDDMKKPIPVVQTNMNENEDWGVEDAEEQTISTENENMENEAENETENEPQEETTTATSVMTVENFLAMMDRMQQFRDAALKDAQNKIEALQKEKQEAVAAFDAKIEKLYSDMRRLGVEATNTPPASTEIVKKRRGRPRASADGSGSTTTPSAKSENSDGETTGRRTRFRNEITLKEAIVQVLTKRGVPVDLKTISNDIVASGFKTTSKKFGNTVRVQLYRLDDDKVIKQYDNGTFGLRKS